MTTYCLSRRAVVNQFLTIFLPVAFLGVAMGVFLYASHATTEQVALETSERQQMTIQENSIARDFRSIVADLMVQSEHHEFQQMFAGHDVEPLGSNLLTFATKKGLYDQVRFLDKTGVEIVRINYNDGQPFVVPDEDLQSKAVHAYFQNTVQLGKGEVYVSPFDLNIERGAIEHPLKPIIRFGTPVFDRQGQKQGIVIFNYLGTNLIRNFIAVQANIPGRLMLLNAKGYWLHGPRPADEWGFMYADRKDRTFGAAFPETWQRIIGADSGQFYDADGLFTFTTMYPLLDVMKSSRSTSQGFNDHAFHPPARDYAWKIVSRVSPDILEAQIHPLQSRLLMLAAGLIVVLALGSWLLARARVSRQQVELKVKERTLQVERLLKQKDEFIHQLGHDLRTPLTPLVTLLPIARSLEKDPEIQGFLDVTIESAGYMKDMVQKILLLAKLNSEHTPIDITDVILQEEVVKSLASSEVCLAQNDNITLENKINKDIIVQADTTYLIEAFNSLLSNAMKYSPEGGTLTIDAIKNNGWVTVSIRDEGVGLTEEQQAKMFDEFYKGDSARHDLKSLGPGLAICKRIIERHGGNIWAESPGLGMGTKVYFTLKSGESEGPSNADTNNGR